MSGADEHSVLIHWGLQSVSGLPPRSEIVSLLSPGELSTLEQLGVAKRRRDWLLGRWTAKRLVQSLVEQYSGRRPPLADIRITTASDGAPEASAEAENGRWPIPSLSISHSHGVGLCALTWSERAGIGADIELVEPRGERFVEEYFTPEEIAQVVAFPDSAREMLVTAIWSAKESVLKALRLGLSVDTRTVSCRMTKPVGAWAGFVAERRLRAGAVPDEAAAASSAGTVAGLWRRCGRFVITLAAASPAARVTPKAEQHRLGRVRELSPLQPFMEEAS